MANISFELMDAANPEEDKDVLAARLEMREGPFNYTVYIDVINAPWNRQIGELRLQVRGNKLFLIVSDNGGNIQRSTELMDLGKVL